MREAGLSNRFWCLSSVQRKKLKSTLINSHKPSKWSQTIANSKKLLYVYLTEVKALRFAVFRLFPTFHNYSQHWLHLFVTSRTGHAVHLETSCLRWQLGNSAFSRSMYFTDIMAIVSAVFSSYFLLFVTFGPTSPASQYSIYGKRSLPHLGYGHTRTQYMR